MKGLEPAASWRGRTGWRPRHLGQLIAGAAMLMACPGCIDMRDAGSAGRSVWVFGFARVKLPGVQGDLPKPVVFEIEGVGLSVGEVTQLGYFHKFEVRLRPESNSAVIIVRSKTDLANLEHILGELQQNHLCLITRS
jgi:hypothetical protein